MKILFKGIVGSHSFGLATETSDVDIKIVYMNSEFEMLSNQYVPQTNFTKDEVGYEIRRFLELAVTGNPNVLELLYLPRRCILSSSPEWEYLLKLRNFFLTKKCYNTFVNYAKSQLRKSKGLNKKFNWEKERITKKDVLDFCTILDRASGNTFKTKDWLKENDLLQEHVGLSKIDNFKDSFKVYIDMLKWSKDNAPNHRYNIDFSDRGYNGIVGEDSYEPRVSEIEKYMSDQWKGVLYFNREHYSIHSREFNEYENWLKNRNEDRVATNKQHGQEFDSKNVLHLVRLMNEANEIATKNTIIVDRTFERDYLLSIKRGEVDLKLLIDQYEEKSLKLKDVFEKSTLPDDVDLNINKLEYNIRTNVL